MRKSLKIVIVLLVVAVVAAALLLNFENRDGAVGAKREPLPLFVAADSADFMVEESKFEVGSNIYVQFVLICPFYNIG